jgi:2-iminobutanoate/2-iminopropanoate deaminase
MKKNIFLISLLLSQIVVASPAPPFSDAVKVGDTLYLSGQIGAINLGEPPVPGGIESQTRQAMENIKNVLEKYNSSLNKIAKCTIMLADMSDWSIMNDVYESYFPNGQYPARSSFGTTGLAFNARVEIECIATVSK